jgi:hypothetical protein
MFGAQGIEPSHRGLPSRQDGQNIGHAIKIKAGNHAVGTMLDHEAA